MLSTKPAARFKEETDVDTTDGDLSHLFARCYCRDLRSLHIHVLEAEYSNYRTAASVFEAHRQARDNFLSL